MPDSAPYSPLQPHDFPDLTCFFSPRSVALVGATEETSRYGGRAFALMREFGFAGPIHPVHPKAATIQGVKAYPSVRELPEAPDHVVVVVSADRVIGVLEDCAARGVPFATVLSSGFAETGTESGRALQRSVTELCRRTGLRVMGPNCNGLVSFHSRFTSAVTATLAGPRRPAGRIGVAAQSGGLGLVNGMWRTQDAGLEVSHAVTCGNDADIDLLDYVNFMVGDDATEGILVIAERISHGAKFFEVARRAAARRKPIAIVKLGRTEQGSRAAASHTGAVTGSDAVHEAAFRQAGVIRVEDCSELQDVIMLLAGGKLARGRRASGLSVSGGSVVMLTDLGASLGIEWPDYTEATHARLAAMMPSYGKVGNPTDLTTAAIGSPDMFRRVLEAIIADANVDVLVPIVTFGPRHEIDAVVEIARASDKPFALLWTGACIDEPGYTRRDVVRQGVPVYRDILQCMKAVRTAAWYGDYIRRFEAGRGRAPDRPAGIDPARARAVLRGRSGSLTEQDSKAVLAAYGFPVTREAVAADAEQAVGIAESIGGPVALKIVSPDIPHKTEARAVRLDVRGPHAVRRAFGSVVTAARKYRADARLEGVLVAEMAPAGLEIMLGSVHDPVFGPVVVAGLGGIHVEVLRDVAYRIAPIDRAEAAAMLRELRGYPLFEGVRGATARDVDAVCDLIVRLSWLAADFAGEIRELDINPVIVSGRGKGAVVVDALVVASTREGGRL